MIYDQIDMRNSYRAGFWIGAAAGSISVFVTCLLIGIYLNS